MGRGGGGVEEKKDREKRGRVRQENLQSGKLEFEKEQGGSGVKVEKIHEGRHYTGQQLKHTDDKQKGLFHFYCLENHTLDVLLRIWF